MEVPHNTVTYTVTAGLLYLPPTGSAGHRLDPPPPGRIRRLPPAGFASCRPDLPPAGQIRPFRVPASAFRWPPSLPLLVVAASGWPDPPPTDLTHRAPAPLFVGRRCCRLSSAFVWGTGAATLASRVSQPWVDACLPIPGLMFGSAFAQSGALLPVAL